LLSDDVKICGSKKQRNFIESVNHTYISSTDHPEKFQQIVPLYLKYLQEFIESKKLIYEALPHVNKLLEYCHKSDEFDLALVTGNTIDAAELKLRGAGINTELFKRDYEGEFKPEFKIVCRGNTKIWLSSKSILKFDLS